MRKCVLLMFLAPLIGSAVAGDITSIKDSVQSVDPSLECMGKIKEVKELKILKGKVEMGFPDENLLTFLAIKNKPKKIEKLAIERWLSESEACTKLGEQWRRVNIHPIYILAIEKMNDGFVSAVAELYSGNISYGAFTKQRRNNIKEFEANIRVASEDIKQKEEAVTRERKQSAERRQQQELADRRYQEQRYQEQQYQQEQYRQQRLQQMNANHQACLNRARNQFDVASCNMENAGAGAATLIFENR